MALFVGWLAFVFESIVAAAFGVIFWRVWAHSAMSKATAKKALLIYAVFSAMCLLVTFFVPL